MDSGQEVDAHFHKALDGCELVSIYMGYPIDDCKACPLETCIYDYSDNMLDNLVQILVKARQKKNIRITPTMTGRWCPYKKTLFCQEGECRGCEVYLRKRKK